MYVTGPFRISDLRLVIKVCMKWNKENVKGSGGLCVFHSSILRFCLF